MKKISLALIAAMAIMFASCGSKTTEKAEEKVEEKVENVAAATEEAAEEATEEVAAEAQPLIEQYSALLDKYLPLVEKVKKGDVTAAAEVAKVAEEIQKFATDNADALKNLSEADAKKYQELAQKFADAMK